MNTKQQKLFVVDVESNGKQIKNYAEVEIVDRIRTSLNHFLLSDNNLDEAKFQCSQIIKEVVGNKPIKGNIHYFVDNAQTNDNNIEIVRCAHGGGNNPSKRINGGVVIATIKTVVVKGELSAIHGFTYYQEENPFFFGGFRKSYTS